MDPVSVGVRTPAPTPKPSQTQNPVTTGEVKAAVAAPAAQAPVEVAPAAPVAAAAPKQSFFGKLFGHKAAAAIAVVVAVVAITSSVLLYHKYQLAQAKIKSLANPQAAAQAEAASLVSQVGKLIQLPANETPTVATVVDASKLKDQSFFANAQNGDKVLIYTSNAKEAILYRPSTNKIIQVAPVNISNNSTTSQPASTPSSSTKK